MKHPVRRTNRFFIRLRRGFLILSAAALILCAGAGPADAQSTAPEEELYLDPITVTATRTPERLSDVADSVEVFSRERIESPHAGRRHRIPHRGGGRHPPADERQGRSGEAFS